MHAQAYHQLPAFAHDATRLSQVEFRVVPELIVVDRQNFGKTPALIRQICDRSLADLGAARHDQVEVIFRSLANHDIRQINARDETGFGPFGYHSNRSAMAEADLQRLIVRLDVEHFDGEFVHLGVLYRHQSSDDAAHQSRRTGELRRQGRSFASSRRRGLDQRLVDVDLRVHRRLLHSRFFSNRLQRSLSKYARTVRNVSAAWRKSLSVTSRSTLLSSLASLRFIASTVFLPSGVRRARGDRLWAGLATNSTRRSPTNWLTSAWTC